MVIGIQRQVDGDMDQDTGRWWLGWRGRDIVIEIQRQEDGDRDGETGRW